MKLNQIRGDLFKSLDALCHCVSADLHMGKGIAVIFKEKFKKVGYLKSQNAAKGGICHLFDDESKRWVYYLVTKDRYFQKPTYASLESSLHLMRDHMLNNDVTKLSMPVIGCGLDKLEWPKVVEIITKIFEGTDVEITVYKLQ
ncbi:hypothetical protein AKO1_009712 [Acrasis kona]|uniref:Macro domain-containing protein n=1 Tax=Acrasis kona TaxID=1008807 RepID=A0AAW2ZNS6_9EUKA